MWLRLGSSNKYQSEYITLHEESFQIFSNPLQDTDRDITYQYTITIYFLDIFFSDLTFVYKQNQLIFVNQGMDCLECLKYQKKMQVLHCDFQFELRKLSQDKSSQKALYEINIQKQMRKLQQKYGKEKIDHEENHKKWFRKIDELTLEYKNKIKQTEQHCSSTISSERQKSLKQFKNTENQLKRRHSEEMSAAKKKYESQLGENQKYYENVLMKKQEQFAKEITKLNKLSAQKQSKKKSEYQSLILGLRSQLNAELRCHSSNQQDFRRQKMRLIGQMYAYKQKIMSSETLISQLKTKIIHCEQIIKDKQEEIISLNLSHQENRKQMKDHYETMLVMEQMRLDEKMKEFCESELKITEKYEESIKRIQENRNIEIKLYESNMNQIKNCIEKRPSRLQDIEQILALKEKLGRKEKELEALEKEFKNFQLDLQNKEEVYNKIFISTVNSTHLYGENILRRKELKMKRHIGKSVSTVRQILISVGSSNLPLLNNLQKKMLPPKSNKIL